MTHRPVRAGAFAAALGIAGAIVALLAIAPSGARAETGDSAGEAVRVRFDAPPGCPDGTRFFDEFRARARHVRAASSDEAALVLRVTVTRDGGATGTLVVEEPTHATRPRIVRGRTCEEVVSALALAAALAIDPHAAMTLARSDAAADRVSADASGNLDDALAPKNDDALAPQNDASSEATPLVDASALSSNASERDASAPLPPAAAESPADSGTAPFLAPHARPWTYTAGALFDVVGAGGLGAVVGASAFLRVDRDVAALLAPAFRLGVAAYGDRAVDATAGAARFTWWVGQLDVCPVRFPVGARVRLEPCAGAEVGVLVASASGVTDEQSHARPWVSVRGLARLEWTVFGPVALEAYAGLRAPITRESFVFDPDTHVYTPPSLMVAGGMGLGAHFP